MTARCQSLSRRPGATLLGDGGVGDGAEVVGSVIIGSPARTSAGSADADRISEHDDRCAAGRARRGPAGRRTATAVRACARPWRGLRRRGVADHVLQVVVADGDRVRVTDAVAITVPTVQGPTPGSSAVCGPPRTAAVGPTPRAGPGVGRARRAASPACARCRAVEPPGRATRQALGRRWEEETGERAGCRLAEFDAQRRHCRCASWPVMRCSTIVGSSSWYRFEPAPTATSRDACRAAVTVGDQPVFSTPASPASSRPSMRGIGGEPATTAAVGTDVQGAEVEAVTAPADAHGSRPVRVSVARRNVPDRGAAAADRTQHRGGIGAAVAEGRQRGGHVQRPGRGLSVARGQSDRRHPGDGTSHVSSYRSTVDHDVQMSTIERSEPRAGVVQLTLNRPESLNAMTSEMVQGCTTSSTRSPSTPQARVVILDRSRSRVLLGARPRWVRSCSGHRTISARPSRGSPCRSTSPR